MSETKVDVKINADTWPFDKAIIRSFVATLGSKGRAYLMDLLLEDAPAVEIVRRGHAGSDIRPVDGGPLIVKIGGTYKLVAVPVEDADV